MEYSIVIPAYNEENKITATLTAVVTFMRSFSSSFNVYVSDDGSKDDTTLLVENFILNNPEVHLLKNPHRGKGATVYSGVIAADGDLIYMADADLSAPIGEIKKLSIWIKDQGYDVVIASREGVGAKRVDEPFYRHLMGRIFNFWVKFIALPGINDSQCGFKLFRKEVAKEIFSRLHIYGEHAKQIDKAYLGAFDVEVLYLARKLKYKVKEVPVTWTYVKTTRLNPLRDSFKMAVDVVRVRLNDIRGVYSVEKLNGGGTTANFS